jgi:hypothetical protein
MTNYLKNPSALASHFNNDVLKIGLELKRVQSIKCRLKKLKGKSSYEKEMSECLAYEQSLKEARSLLVPKEKPVTEYEQKDADILDYDETIKAIKSIQSKKCLTKWLTTEEGNNDEYKKACQIEEMLLEHKKTVQPIEETTVRKTDVKTIIETLENNKELTTEQISELLKKLM